MNRYSDNTQNQTMSSLLFLTAVMSPFGSATGEVSLPPTDTSREATGIEISESLIHSPTFQAVTYRSSASSEEFTDQTFVETMSSFYSQIAENQIQIEISMDDNARRKLWELY